MKIIYKDLKNESHRCNPKKILMEQSTATIRTNMLSLHPFMDTFCTELMINS